MKMEKLHISSEFFYTGYLCRGKIVLMCYEIIVAIFRTLSSKKCCPALEDQNDFKRNL